MAVGLAVTRFATAEPSPPPIVRVFVAGSDEALSETRDAIEDLCARSNVAVIVRDAAGADERLLSATHPSGLAEAYVDLRPNAPGQVVVVDGESRQTIERRTLPSPSTLEMSIETAAEVVCSAVDSILATRVPAEAAPRVVPAAPVPAPDSAPPLLDENAAHGRRAETAIEPSVAVYGSVTDLGLGAAVGMGASFGLAFGDRRVRPGAQLSITGYAPNEVDRFGGEASFAAISTRLVPTLEWRASSFVSLFAGVGGGVDWMRVTDAAAPPGGALRTRAATVNAIGTGLVGVSLWLGRWAGAMAACGADVDLFRHGYAVATPSGPAALFEPPRVAPLGLIGLFISLNPSRPASDATAPRR
ncbi:MAG TPA: hypothetical protein VHC69_20770 [Polyangiaceae bacterium]|nr:hypothetical protein [Polyangiaceae bacterium]